jgi:integrase
MSSFVEFASWLRAGNLSEGTIALRIHHLKRFCRDHDLDTATSETVIKWLENPGWKPATKLSARASLKSYYRWAMESGRLDADPTAKTRTIKMPPRAIKEAPQDALLTALEGAHERDRLAIMLAAYAGLRRAEIANLHADQIGDRMLTVTGKGSKTRRVPIHPMLVEPLRKVQAVRSRRMRWGAGLLGRCRVNGRPTVCATISRATSTGHRTTSARCSSSLGTPRSPRRRFTRTSTTMTCTLR